MSKTQDPTTNQSVQGASARLANRRSFIKAAGAAGGAGAVGALSGLGLGAAADRWMGGPRTFSANDRINVAHIGVGQRGTARLVSVVGNSQRWNTRSIAVADPNVTIAESARAAIQRGGSGKPRVQSFKDHRRVLDCKDVDAVFVAAPVPWQLRIAEDALSAGKHVYLELPLSPALPDWFALYDRWLQTRQVMQVSSPASSELRYHAAVAHLGAGQLGPVSTVKTSGMAGASRLSDRLIPLLMTVGDGSWPLEVASGGDLQNDPGQLHLLAHMSGGWRLELSARRGQPVFSEAILGADFALRLHGDEAQVLAPRTFWDTEHQPEATRWPMTAQRHEKNFLDSVRGQAQPHGSLSHAIRGEVLASLAETAATAERVVIFEPSKRSWRFA